MLQSINERVPKNIEFFNFPPEKIEALFFKMGKEINYRNYIILNYSYLDFQVKPELKNVIAACDKIIHFLSKEIDL